MTTNSYELQEIIEFNPKETIKKKQLAKKIPMEKLNVFSKKITGYEIEEFNGGSKFRNGDTLLARITPCLENGKTALVDILDENEIGFGSTEFIVLRPKNNKITNEFLYYLATSPSFRKKAISSMIGTSGRKRVREEALKTAVFDIPDIETQNRISSLLSLFDEEISILEHQNEDLEKLKKYLFKRWFIEFEFPDESGKPYKTNGGKMIEHDMGIVPEGWKPCTIYNNIIECSEKNKLNESLPVLSVISSSKFVYSDDYFKEQVYSKDLSKYRIINKGEIGFNPSRANIGSIAILTEFEKGLLSPMYKVFKANETTMTQGYLHGYIKQDSFISNIASCSFGTVRMNFNLDYFKRFKIILPPMSIQNEFDKIVKISNKYRDLNCSNIERLKELKSLLLEQLMAGKIII